MNQGILIVISGASGVGKGTVCKKILHDYPNIIKSISATTRSPRQGEVDGRDYYFLSEGEFKNWIDDGKFLEYTEVHGNLYGTPLKKLAECLNRGEDVLTELDVQGERKIRKIFPDSINIFLLPSSFTQLRSRLENRHSETAQSLELRLKDAVEEIKIGLEYDYVIVNASIDRVAEQIEAIITAEHCKVIRNREKFSFEGEFE